MPVCTPVELDCVKEIELEDPACLPECSGVSITNVQENSNDMDQIIGSDYLKLVKQYERYEYLNKTLQISSGCKKYLVQRIFFTNCERFRIQIRRQSSLCENIYEHADV